MQTVAVDLIKDLVETRFNSPVPVHGVEDLEKLETLKADMLARGWHGPPVVVDGDYAITGSHRIAAHTELTNEIDIDLPFPQVQIADVCALYGVNWGAHLKEWQDLLPGPHADPWTDAARTIAEKLPSDVVDYLGLDLH